MKTHIDCRLSAAAVCSPAAPWGRTTSGPRCRRRRRFARRSRCRRREAASLADLKWLEVFKDEKLQELIRTALVQNYDLRDAVARVEAARANLGITRSEPVSAMRTSAATSDHHATLPRRTSCRCRRRSCPRRIATCGQATLNLLSFEVDIWGRLRRATEAARANLLSAEENRKAVVTTLVSDVATDYFSLRELDYELEISQRTLGTRQESLRLIQEPPGRRRGDAARPAPGANNWCTPPRETIPALQQQIEQTENQISLLLGKNPGEVIRGRSLTEQEMPPEVPAGLAVRAAGAPARHSRGRAESDRRQRRDRRRQGRLFPANQPERISGRAEHATSSLFSGPHSVWSFVPQVTQPIFTAGRLKIEREDWPRRSARARWFSTRRRFRRRSPKSRTR